jgi:hypothetical protein
MTMHGCHEACELNTLLTKHNDGNLLILETCGLIRSGSGNARKLLPVGRLCGGRIVVGLSP